MSQFQKEKLLAKQGKALDAEMKEANSDDYDEEEEELKESEKLDKVGALGGVEQAV